MVIWEHMTNVRTPLLELQNATTYITKDGSNNLSFTDAVTGTKTLAQLSASGGGPPTGTVLLFGGSNANVPSGYLLCDGSVVSQSTYAALYAVIGHNFAADPGGGNFTLPSMDGQFAKGISTGPAGCTGGAMSHVHSVNGSTGYPTSYCVGYCGSGASMNWTDKYHCHQLCIDVDCCEHLPPYVNFVFIIKT